jgi:hypothetical protein
MERQSRALQVVPTTLTHARTTTMANSNLPTNKSTPTIKRRSEPRFLWLFLGKTLLLLVTIFVVYSIYVYLHAYRLDWLGRAYVLLLPLTNDLYAMVETHFSDDMKYKIRGAITDDLGQRSLFLLLLTATVELTLYSLFKFLKYVVLGPRRV